jgi:hypothetical protein
MVFFIVYICRHPPLPQHAIETMANLLMRAKQILAAPGATRGGSSAAFIRRAHACRSGEQALHTWIAGRPMPISPLKERHLLRCTHPSSVNVLPKYASLLGISCALHLVLFERAAPMDFFNGLPGPATVDECCVCLNCASGW